EMGRWGDGEMGRWGDGEMGCIRYLPLIPSSNQLLPIFSQLLLQITYFMEIPSGVIPFLKNFSRFD
ncbi:hypothetical protein ACP6PK_03195, partial [Dapis sp. BLCC M172]